MKRLLPFILVLLIGVMARAQSSLSVSVTGTVNTDCIGQGCYYNGPTILINEVMLSPSMYDGSMVGSSYHTSGGGEWIELYNPHKCDSVDISCYFLGNNAYDNTNQTGNWGGGFALPAGTVIPPQGFCMVRGYRAAAVPDSLLVQNGGNVVEVVIDDRYCLDAGGGRLWFPNAGGWFAFYDANGVPQDAISWCSQSNSCMSCYPCTPVTNDCGFSGVLPSYDQIPASRKTYITSLNPQSYLGSSFRRIPDGGNWQSTGGTPTYATCNDVCIDPPVIFCAAIAVATPSGGTPPYTYLWSDDSQQITDTAFGLCAGTYYVTVTDADNQTVVGEVTIVDYEPPVSHPDYIECLHDSSIVLSGLPAGGVYEGGWVDANQNFFFHDSAAVYPMAYTFTDTNGCSATANFTITVNPDYDHYFYDTICQREPYSGYGFTASSTQTSSIGTQTLHNDYSSINQCDSSVTLYLTVLPSEIFTHDTAICEGEDFDGFNFQLAATELNIGLNQAQQIFTNQYGCDSTENLNLTVNPVYDLHVTENVCRNEIYSQYNFLFSADTMELGEHTFIYEGASSSGCDSTFTLIVSILPTSETIFFDTICQHDTYQQHNFSLSDEAVAHAGDVDFVQNLQNVYGCDSTVTLHMVIYSKPQVDFISNPERIMLSDGSPVQFINLTDLSDTYPGETFTWHWDFGDGEEGDSDVDGASHTYGNWGNFPVTLTVTGTYGCESVVSHNVYVDADLEFPNIITPNGDGVNDVFAIVNLNPELDNVLTIYDRWGQKVFEMKNYRTYIKDGVLYNAETGFSAEHNSDGVYYYTFHYVGFVRAVEYHSSLTIIR